MLGYVVDLDIEGLDTTKSITIFEVHKLFAPVPSKDAVKTTQDGAVYKTLDGDEKRAAQVALVASLRAMPDRQYQKPDDETLLQEL